MPHTHPGPAATGVYRGASGCKPHGGEGNPYYTGRSVFRLSIAGAGDAVSGATTALFCPPGLLLGTWGAVYQRASSPPRRVTPPFHYPVYYEIRATPRPRHVRMCFLESIGCGTWADWRMGGGRVGAYRDAARPPPRSTIPIRIEGKKDGRFSGPGRLSGPNSWVIYGGYGGIPAQATRREAAWGRLVRSLAPRSPRARVRASLRDMFFLKSPTPPHPKHCARRRERGPIRRPLSGMDSRRMCGVAPPPHHTRR